MFGKNAVNPLITYLLTDADWYMREVAAKALGRIGDKRAVEPLITALEDPSMDVRETATWALGKLADPQAIPRLTSLLGDLDDVLVADNAEWALEQIGQPAVAALTDVLHDDDERKRARAAYVLMSIKDVSVYEPVLVLLADESSFVRFHAVAALAAIGGTRAIEPIKGLRNDPDHEVRNLVCQILLELEAKGDDK